MSLVNIEQIGVAAKLTYSNGEVLYTWKDGRFFVSADNENIESVNFALASDDKHYTQNFKFSEQSTTYGATDAIEFCEYLILNELFFLMKQ